MREYCARQAQSVRVELTDIPKNQLDVLYVWKMKCVNLPFHNVLTLLVQGNEMEHVFNTHSVLFLGLTF